MIARVVLRVSDPDVVRRNILKYPANVFFPNRGKAIIEFDPNNFNNISDFLSEVTEFEGDIFSIIEAVDVDINDVNDIFGNYFRDVCFGRCGDCDYLITSRDETDYFFDLLAEAIVEKINELDGVEADVWEAMDSPNMVCIRLSS